tara:strand:+ start:31029 stop:31337 length:309 start_codon:yes stop_codon:yes gene_type:complete
MSKELDKHRDINTLLDCLEQAEIVGEMLVEAVMTRKFGLRFGLKLIRQLDDISDLCSQLAEGNLALELQDLDENEAGQLGMALFSVAKCIQEEVKKHRKAKS